MLSLTNIIDGETVHQRCLLICGHDAANLDSKADHVVISTTDMFDRVTFPEQKWPMSNGHFKALLILSPGLNQISIRYGDTSSSSGEPIIPLSLKIIYTPLLQLPPLHLAILIAKDSPLTIDCPPAKHGALSSAHSSLDAAISKFRMTAYMWQALTAEDLRSKGLGRRSFRLEEEWGLDTLSQDFLNVRNESTFEKAMQSTAKIHLIRTEMTVSQLRDPELAQQNPSGKNRDELHGIFSRALKAHNGIFESAARPVVAGLILDSHFSMTQNLILAHAALGAHHSNGLSLGMFGSHLTYSWPRFLEEVADCLLDTKPPGDTVGNDNGECLTMWEACSVGQGAFLHEVGHAFSAPHTTGIMARGYSQHWPKNFLAHTAYSAFKSTPAISPVTSETFNDAKWDIRDALRFKGFPHFRLPSDPPISPKLAQEVPTIELLDDEHFLSVAIKSEIGIAHIWFNDKIENSPSVMNPQQLILFTHEELEGRFPRDKPLVLEVCALNGQQRSMDVWKLFTNHNVVRVPGTSIRLQKKSVGAQDSRPDPDNNWLWTVMLKKRSISGKVIPAKKIDIRVGAGLDGAVVHYKDDTKIPCGPRWDPQGKEVYMGGHQARKLALPTNSEIVKVEVADGGWGGELSGLRIHLSNGKAMGALNKGEGIRITPLEPPSDHKIIGFYGTSGVYNMCSEFGIVSAPKDVQLPDILWDMPELQNDNAGKAKRGKKRRKQEEGEEVDDEISTSEDEDEGYDDDGYDS